MTVVFIAFCRGVAVARDLCHKCRKSPLYGARSGEVQWATAVEASKRAGSGVADDRRDGHLVT